MLGLAAGDTAGGAWELGYSAHTEQATVVAYQLVELGHIDPPGLLEGMREMDGANDEEPVFRSESAPFRAWLDRAAAGQPVPDEDRCLDAGPRAVPLGVCYRRDPEAMREQALLLGRMFHLDAISILVGGVVASAVAASCFGQSGRDLVAGVAEAVGPMVALLADDEEIVGKEMLDGVMTELGELVDLVGVQSGEEALQALGNRGDETWDLVRAGLLISAPVPLRDHLPVEQAARIGGSPLGAMVGGIVGARVGIKAWPWAFPNDTWFAEIGRRLVRGPAEVRDLPIPYAVEQHLISGERRGFH